jgi:hypothetical protein
MPIFRRTNFIITASGIVTLCKRLYSKPLLKLRMAPKLKLLISSGSKKKDPRYLHLSAARASHSHKVWDKVSPLTPHFLHSGLSSNPIKWRCLRRVLCSARRPVTPLDWFLLKDKSLILVPGQGPEINSQACLRVLSRSRQMARCWLMSQHLSLFLMSHLETPKAGSGPSCLRAEPSLASPSAISLPRTPACPGTQNSPTTCRAEISFNAS